MLVWVDKTHNNRGRLKNNELEHLFSHATEKPNDSHSKKTFPPVAQNSIFFPPGRRNIRKEKVLVSIYKDIQPKTISRFPPKSLEKSSNNSMEEEKEHVSGRKFKPNNRISDSSSCMQKHMVRGGGKQMLRKIDILDKSTVAQRNSDPGSSALIPTVSYFIELFQI